MRFLDDTPLPRKLPLVIVGLAVLCVVAAAISGMVLAGGALENAARDRLLTLQESKTEQLERYLGAIEEDLRITAANRQVATALVDFDTAFAAAGPDAVNALQDAYIADNPFPTGEKDELERADGPLAYHAVHGTHHSWFRQLLRERGYYDIFLINRAGDIVYTVFKELDYATNLATGQWADTDLARVWEAANGAPRESIAFTDFAPYGPSYDAPASFIATPVFAEGERVGVLAFQMPIDRINAIMGNRTGLGDAGISYVVGTDGLLRSELAGTDTVDILSLGADTAPVREALAGNHGVSVGDGLLGAPVIAAYGPLSFNGTDFAVVAEVPRSDALAAVDRIRTNTVIGVLAVIAILTPLSILLSRALARPILALAETMRRLAAGDTAVAVPGTDRGDEIGRMAEAVEVFRANAVEAENLARQAAADRARFEEERAAQEARIDTQVGEIVAAAAEGDFSKRIDADRLEGVLAGLGRGVNSLLDTVDSVMGELDSVLGALAAGDLTRRCESSHRGRFGEVAAAANATADRLSDIADSLKTSSNSIDTAVSEILDATRNLANQSEHQATRLDGTASAMEELTVTVRQNAENAKQAAERASAAHAQASEGGKVLSETVAAIRAIRTSSNRIQEIVEIISDITFQTNLLALNASVEAARAGDAGRGFAVVAQEVRNLAQRSGQASRDIKDLIDQSAGHVDRGVDLITRTDSALGDILQEVAGVSNIIAEFSAASQEQATGLEEVNRSVSGMEALMQQNQSMVAQTNASCESLFDQAEALKDQVRFFETGRG